MGRYCDIRLFEGANGTAVLIFTPHRRRAHEENVGHPDGFDQVFVRFGSPHCTPLQLPSCRRIRTNGRNLLQDKYLQFNYLKYNDIRHGNDAATSPQ